MRTTASVSPTLVVSVVRSPPGSVLLELSPGPQRHHALRLRLMGAMLAAGMQPVDVVVQTSYGLRSYDDRRGYDQHAADLTFYCPCRREQIRERRPIRWAPSQEESDDQIVFDVVHGLADHIRDDIAKGLL